MATVRAVERKVRRVEGFEVRILHPSGVDVRGDREGLPQYEHKRALKNSSNVKSWKLHRFRLRYPGFDVEVVDAHGQHCHGNMLLGTVRDTYLDDR